MLIALRESEGLLKPQRIFPTLKELNISEISFMQCLTVEQQSTQYQKKNFDFLIFIVQSFPDFIFQFIDIEISNGRNKNVRNGSWQFLLN